MVKPDGELVESLRSVRYLLLDFDGPVCSVFAALPASAVAARVREAVEKAGGHLPLDEATERDPIEVFRRTANSPPRVIGAASGALQAAEVEAVLAARPTPGVNELLDACARVDVTIAIVTNNSADAVDEYLRARRLRDAVAIVVGRDPKRPELLKPHPYLVQTALRALNARATDCVLLGDSVGDISAAQAVAVPAIGFANKDGKGPRLTEAGARAIVSNIADVAAGLLSLRDAS